MAQSGHVWAGGEAGGASRTSTRQSGTPYCRSPHITFPGGGVPSGCLLADILSYCFACCVDGVFGNRLVSIFQKNISLKNKDLIEDIVGLYQQ